MRSLDGFPRILLYVGRVDFRKSIDGLAEIIETDMGESPFVGDALFVFVSSCRRRMKVLYWDRTGFALWLKRLEKERFCWPRKMSSIADSTTMTLSQSQLELLLEGIDVFKIKPHATLSFACIA